VKVKVVCYTIWALGWSLGSQTTGCHSFTIYFIVLEHHEAWANTKLCCFVTAGICVDLLVMGPSS